MLCLCELHDIIGKVSPLLPERMIEPGSARAQVGLLGRCCSPTRGLDPPGASCPVSLSLSPPARNRSGREPGGHPGQSHLHLPALLVRPGRAALQDEGALAQSLRHLLLLRYVQAETCRLESYTLQFKMLTFRATWLSEADLLAASSDPNRCELQVGPGAAAAGGPGSAGLPLHHLSAAGPGGPSLRSLHRQLPVRRSDPGEP